MKQYFPALTGFRAIAAWIVFAHHYNPFPRNGSIGFLSNLLHESYIGVSMFFVLSGFLIAIRYSDSDVSYGSYIRNRFAKIYPLFFLLTTLTFLVAMQWDTLRYLACITFVQGFLTDWRFAGIGQSWSLTVEEMFYLLAPLIFISIRRSKLSWLMPLGFLLIGLLIYSGSKDFMLQYTFFGRSFDFFAGIMLAKLYQRSEPTTNHQQPTTTHHQLFTWSGIAGILLCLVLLAIVRGDTAYGVFTPAGLAVHHLLLPVSTTVLLWGLIKEKTWVQSLLSTSVMQLFGRSSYAFYLIHIGVIAAWLSDSVSTNVLVLFVLLNGVAIALYYAVEKPLHSAVRGSRG